MTYREPETVGMVSTSNFPAVDSPEIGVKKSITKKRVSVSKEKANVGKLGPKTEAYIPDDIEVMYAAKNSLDLIKQQVCSENALGAFLREYPSITPEVKHRLEEQHRIFMENFEVAKKNTIKLAENHPLWKMFSPIKGFTAYQLGIIMACVKNPEKFETPSKLMIYAGLGAYRGLPVNKLNMNRIKDMYLAEGKEFKGFNTLLAGRMEVITDCLMRGKGWFYNFYLNKKDFKIATAQNEKLQKLKKGDFLFDDHGKQIGKYDPNKTPVWDSIVKDHKGKITHTPNGYICFTATKEDRKASGNVMEVGKEYMWGKKNQSLLSYADRAAKKAVKRILLHTVYTQWMLYKGLTPRNPYAIEYLGHTTLIKLEEIVAYDKAVVNTKKRKAKPGGGGE